MSWSLLYPQLTVFPLHPIVTHDPDNDVTAVTCGCGNPACSDTGKHPAYAWASLQPGEKIRSPHHPRAGYGIATGERSGIFVVDCDGPDGLAAFEGLGPCPRTFTVRRGPGRHFYFQHPGFRVLSSRSQLAKHVDIRGDGGYIVAPGSPHKTGDRYEIETDAPVADAPEWLLDWLRGRLDTVTDCVQPYEGDVEGDELAYHERLYREYLAKVPPSIDGHGGDHQLWRVVQHGAYDLALPADVVLTCVREVFDPRCQPPWGEELNKRVAHKIKCAKEHSTRPPNCPVPLDLIIDEGIEAAPTPDDPELAELEAELRVTWGRWDEEIPPPRYIVQDVVPHDTLGMIVAKGSSLKTWMALSVGIAVATGQPWLGKFGTEQGNVLIVDFESGTWQLRHRAQKLGAYSTPGLGHANFPQGRIDDPGFWVKLTKLCKARNVKLVIIDSFAAGAPGVDENDSAAAAPLAYAARFSDVCQCSVLFIHHAKKGEGGDERDLVRGSGAIYAGVDWAVTMIPQDDNRTRMLVRNIKPWGPRPEDFRIELTKDGALVLDVEAAKPSEEQEGESVKAAIRAALVRPAPSKALLAKAVGKSKVVVSLYLEGLEATREVVKLPGVGYVLDDEDKRKARARQALEAAPCATVSQMAQRAHVDVDKVSEWIADGLVVRSAEGAYMFAG